MGECLKKLRLAYSLFSSVQFRPGQFQPRHSSFCYGAFEANEPDVGLSAPAKCHRVSCMTVSFFTLEVHK
ncbi:hypothetical protein VCR15J2_20516 [Vibrio coralliirubri]|nr:hypothetical protein VCR15J2_20516 [Vibrio coralliirubri]